ncbi:extensin-like [Lathyrus oleraceus]|uniref:extensin-like n=1 Tax=Pisum sativum TaxID=3888 RepID=UPI0021D099B1|nr:extensin-like [Pisum sativum]
MVTMTSLLHIALIYSILNIVFSNGLPPSTEVSQSPTPFHIDQPSTELSQSPTPLHIDHEILKPYSPYKDLRKSRKRSPPPPSSPPPPPPPPPSFDHFKLALTWPQTFCKIETCLSPLPQTFVIHGLWPSKRDTEIRDCKVGT